MKPIKAAQSLCLAAVFCASVASATTIDYKIDPDHTYPSFEASHMGISVWRGKFKRTTGEVKLDKTGSGSFDVDIDLASIDFGLPKLDDWAKSDQFFDVAKYPHATYKGRLEGFVDGAPTKATGELTLHGVTKPVALKINSFKCIPHPMLKRELCGADALATFERDAFGLAAGKDYGFSMDVTLRIQVEAIAVK